MHHFPLFLAALGQAFGARVQVFPHLSIPVRAPVRGVPIPGRGASGLPVASAAAPRQAHVGRNLQEPLGAGRAKPWVGRSAPAQRIREINSKTAGRRAGPPAAMASIASMRWLFESFVSVGGIQMGINGLSAQLQFLAPVTAILGILKSKSVGKLPLLPYSAMLATTTIFTTYGFLVGNKAIWAPHMTGVFLSAAYTVLFLASCPKEADWLPFGRGAHVGGLLALGALMAGLIAAFDAMTAAKIIGLLGNAVCIAMFGGPLSAIKTVLRDRSTKSLPFAFGICTLINASLWCFYGAVYIRDPLIWFPNLLGVSSGIAQMALFARFGFAG